ncbi:hypothetical protein L596_017038 [Steinernema carpocapsae]|uniref:Uncharacterized protein n=1 Tax=Steinernema carpocapsae TaxID=34508 RepID=A0A4U5N098_STECR|nr:hypothetical protein L596_017038 [Steinernema carpocapsae]
MTHNRSTCECSCTDDEKEQKQFFLIWTTNNLNLGRFRLCPFLIYWSLLIMSPRHGYSTKATKARAPGGPPKLRGAGGRGGSRGVEWSRGRCGRGCGRKNCFTRFR